MKVIKVKATADEKRDLVLKAMRQLGERGAIFTTDFHRTRSDNEHRNMPCRLNVKKGLKGGEAPYDFTDNNLALVFDMGTAGKKGERGFKAIPVEGIHWLGNRDVRFEFEDI